MKYLTIILSSLIIPASAIVASDLSNLQQQTNQAYEQMKQIESQLSNARKEVQIKQDNLRYHQEKVTETEKALRAAQQTLESVEDKYSTARRKWNDSSENLYQKWHRKE